MLDQFDCFKIIIYRICSLKHRLLPNYIITKRVLAETQSLLGLNNFRPRKIVDFGMGVGSASASALDYFHHDALLKKRDKPKITRFCDTADFKPRLDSSKLSRYFRLLQLLGRD